MMRAFPILTLFLMVAGAAGGQCVAPWTEDFETSTVPTTAPGACSVSGLLPTGWSSAFPSASASNVWTPWSGTTPSSGVGPTGDHTTGNGIYLYCEASGCTNYTAVLNAPCCDMTGVAAPTVEFWAHMSGAGIVSLECQEFDGIAWNTVWSRLGSQGNQWIFASVPLTTVAGQATVRFVAMGTDWTADIAIDDVKMGEISGNDWQVNQPAFGIDVNGATTSGFSSPAAVYLQSINCAPIQPASATLNIYGTLPGAEWAMGIVSGSLIPASSPASIVFPNGTIVNLDLGDPSFQWLSDVLGNGSMYLPGFLGGTSVSVSIPFDIVGPSDLAIQAYAIDPGSSLGASVSQGVEIHVAAQGSASSLPGPTVENTSVAIDVVSSPACWSTTGIDFFGTTYTTIHVSDNGRVTFGAPDNDNTATLAEALAGVPFVGLWSDFGVSSGYVSVTNPQANVIRVNYNSLPLYGGGGSTTSHNIEFDVATGDVTINLGAVAALAGIGPQNARFLGLSGGGGLPATDPGAAVFMPGAAGAAGAASDMLYDWLAFGAGNQLSAITAGVTSIRFVNVGGYYDWIAY